MMDFLKGLEESGLGTWVRQSNSLFAFPGILFCHTLGMALVAGTSTLISMRILGIAPEVPMQALDRLYPYVGRILAQCGVRHPAVRSGGDNKGHKPGLLHEDDVHRHSSNPDGSD